MRIEVALPLFVLPTELKLMMVNNRPWSPTETLTGSGVSFSGKNKTKREQLTKNETNRTITYSKLSG